jgi:phytoene desaturase
MNKSVVVVGAGLGGLTAALRLNKRGYQVRILEKNSNAGGRLNQIRSDGFSFDTGPSFFSMSYEFRELADDCGIVLPFRTIELDPLYAINFSNRPETFIMYKDINKLAGQFRDIEPDFDTKMNRYLNKGKQLFEETFGLVVHRNYDSVLQYLLTLMKAPPGLLPVLFRNFWQQVSRYFNSDEVKQIVSLVAFFLGRTPFDTPAVYTMLSYTEFRHDGYYNVEGGMYKIVEGFVRLLKERGVEITYGTEITGFHGEDERLEYLTDQRGQHHSADIYLINADAAVFRGRIFRRAAYSERRLDRMKWTMGPLTIYLGVKGRISGIRHHNYFLGSNFEDYARKVFLNPGVVEKPYYYVNVLSHSNPECAPPGCEGLFFVCPVPDLRYKSDWSDREEIVDNIIQDFSRRIGRDISEQIITKKYYTPEDWASMFNLHRGSGLGLSHDMHQIGAFRPANHDERFSNVFYAGASTAPGTGLPLVIISSKLAVERIAKAYGTV